MVCPGCGGTFSLEGWENDAAVRQFNGVLGELPYQVREQAARYLGLFRVGERGLSWKRALRIVGELRDLVGKGTVHWEGGETRPAPADLWAEVMCEMCEKGKRELDGHNYLRKVVWTRARGLAVKKEQSISRGVAESAEEKNEGERPKARGCFRCESFRPPKGCGAKSRPASGNQILGCEKWTEKKAAATIGELAENIAKLLTSENTENKEGQK